MHNDTATNTLPSPALTPTQQADAALRATSLDAKAENTRQLAALADSATESHVAEHIRGLVAWTVAHVSIDASDTTREHTENWQQWALSVAEGIERGQTAHA